MFKDLSKEKIHLVEESLSKRWKEMNILEKSIQNRDDYWVFYDGPATANGMPGLHHMVAKFLKDSFCKYKTMQGKKVIRKVGWDTHGLPVEVQVEKELGFSGKQEIEKYGIKEFNQKCREAVWTNEKAFSDLTVKMGQFIDLDNPYVTYDNDYIETEWWILNKFFEEGLFYEGYKILPYCPRCETGLASHEVAQGYKEVDVDSVIVTMKKKDEDVYFLVWTTTPWTLISNAALCVHPDEDYVLAESKGHKFILAEKLVKAVLGEEHEILEKYKGKDLEYFEYEQLLPFLKTDKKAFYVVVDEYVSMDDGTGIVHIAPAFGQDDYNIGRRYDLPFFNPVNDEGKYTEGPWKDLGVFEADPKIIDYLKENNRLFKKQKINHNYPHCWRCDTGLIYSSKPSYYLEISKIKDQIIANNKTVNWYPDFIGEKRFANWLENLNDWAISRNRYWGTPLPLWKCECGHQEMIPSREVLRERAIEEVPEDIDLHRPFVDEIHLTCPKCQKEMTRTEEVIDCWFDSGAMPFAQYHYPFENEDLFKTQFPADFICEGIDQTRGWFYSLMVISSFVKGVSPYKNVLVNDLLLDKEGKKMSKSKGNVLDPFALMKEYGADTIRWYLPYVSPVWTPLKFDEEGLKEVYSKFFNPLRNSYNFFVLYANTDKVDPRKFKVDYQDLEEIDRWLVSKYNQLLKYVEESFEAYDLYKVVRAITHFVSEDLSNWYIRRNRRRFWGSELDTSKKAVYQTTYEVLLGLSKMIAPIIPFLSEEIYLALDASLESVHLEDFPKYDETLIDLKLEEKMDLVRDLISLGRNAREEAKIKVRQPLSEIVLDAKNKEIIDDLVDLIKEELNVKDIRFVDDLSNYMNVEIKANFKVCGPIFGSNMKEAAQEISKLSYEQVKDLELGQEVGIIVAGDFYKLNLDMIELRVSSKEGFNASYYERNFVVLNTSLNEELINEGIARELISRVQQLRKTKDFEVSDRIILYYESSPQLDEVMKSFEDLIKAETLSEKFQAKKELSESFEVNNLTIKIDVEKIK